MAGTYNITADQGATFLLTVTWTTPGATPSPVDLTNFSAHMQVRTQLGAAGTVLDLSTQDGTITLGGAQGTISINIPAEMMAQVAAGSYRYDLNVSSSDATPIVTKLIAGSFKVTGAVTDP